MLTNRLVAAILVLLPLGWQLHTADKVIEFNRDVRPILSDRCFTCHGPDAKAKRIPFRLDVEDAAKADLGGGRRAIVAGDAERSELVRRITSTDEAMRMPPAYSGLKLNAEEIGTLRHWIAQGAKWQQHWSLIPPKHAPSPAVANRSWPKNPIDRFILARLEREGLRPSPEASRETLLRRVTLDLTGLPPTPAEIDSFLQDRSPISYQKVVDRLLSSPRYGERMAARWLDAARYADTNGYQFDGERVMWRWRDWVIQAFNRNQPFDQFTVEQIAGDMLPTATMHQKIATAFNRNHRGNTEDGIVPEEYAVEYVVDRLETTGTVFLGLTIGCARCHNHKYDPFSQKEFYQLYAYFNNIPERGRAMKYGNSPPLVPAPTQEQESKLHKLMDRLEALQSTLRQRETEIAKAQAAWEKGLADAGSLYWAPTRALELSYPFEENKDAATSLELGRIGNAARFNGTTELNAGDVAGFDIEDAFTISTWVYPDEMPDGSIASKMIDDPKGRGYGLHLNQGRVYAHLTTDWTTDAIRLQTEDTLSPKRWHHIALTYTGSIMAEGLRVYIDGTPARVQIQLDTLYRPFRNAGRKFTEPFRIGGGAGKKRFRGLIDDMRVYSRVLKEEEISALAVGASLNEIASKPESRRTPSERAQMRWYFLDHSAAPDLRDIWKQHTALEQEKDLLVRSFPTVMVMDENPVRKDTFLLIRGAYDKRGEKVQPGIPAVLPPLPAGASNDRLGFAKWLVDRANPLSARVAVNRFWQMYFGTGLVKTSEDFGVQGEWPSHPELLDWLASEFIRSGWNTKALQKLIVTSATYRQLSRGSTELNRRDPENRLLARGPRFRLPAEIIRDQALFASGLLFEKIGGPSVTPYQPAGLWNETSMQDMEYQQSRGADLYRRSLYTFWKRTIAPPLMVNFDSAMRESCVVRDNRTNTPLQALNLMNDVTFLESARFLGQRMMREGGATPAARLRHGFRLALGRSPSVAEGAVLQNSFNYHLGYFARERERAVAYLRHGDSPFDSTLDPCELSAYAAVASLILNLDEMVTKE